MENYETLKMPELKALPRECELRGYSQLRKAELIAFLQNNEHRARRRQRLPQMSTWEPNRPPQMSSTWEPNRPPQRHARAQEGPGGFTPSARFADVYLGTRKWSQTTRIRSSN